MQAIYMQRTATLMVREVLYACQAVNGKFLTLPDNEEGLAQISPNLKIRKPERQLMLKLSELGWLFRWKFGTCLIKVV